ncbi:MAG: formamidopyrimidine DNA glycosylase [Chloroflexota bacterium]|nr:formamidopyrimidine DNA glycosylase [Chloroflexota bacterium]
MPEGDNLARIADVLRASLLERTISRVGGRAGDRLQRLLGERVSSVEARGKHLLIGFAGGLTLHTHLGLHGSWHRYRSGERWRRPATRAAVVIETAGAVAVCFDPTTVELLETRALAVHPVLSRLGPDAAADQFDADAAVLRLRQPSRARMPIGDALLDQTVLAGVGNVYRSELCFIERVNPLAPVGTLDDATLRRLVERASALLRANLAGGRRVTTPAGTAGDLYVYGRTGRPCRRCGTAVTGAMTVGRRRAYWCPRCQPQPLLPAPGS